MKQNYKEQLSDSRWLRKKNEILERDNYTCQKCGATSHLNVHHLSYEKDKRAWEYPNERLITLCQSCHENEHDIVTYPMIGKFYTYDHSDYWNDMICYYINRKENRICLFGVDCGGYGTPYITYFSFEEFFNKCRNSRLIFDQDKDSYDEYTSRSFYLAYNEIIKKGNLYIDAFYPYTKEQNIAFTLKEIQNVISKREDIIKSFNLFKMEESL